MLVWLEVDTRLRDLTGGKRSLDDFCRSFFAPPISVTQTKRYRFGDIVAGLNAIAPYDWETFLRERLDDTSAEGAPKKGIELGGYRLAFHDAPNAFAVETGRATAPLNLSDMGGLLVSNDGSIDDILWAGAADSAGLRRGEKIVTVDGQPFSREVMLAAIARTKSKGPDITLSIAGRSAPVTLSYHLGLRYPWLDRSEEVPDRLTDIFAPKAKSAARLNHAR